LTDNRQQTGNAVQMLIEKTIVDSRYPLHLAGIKWFS
jgi:hypothetical protein